MKLGMAERTDISAGVQEEIKIAFEANAVAFYAQISGLAKDKKRYPVRELSTNAWDESKGDFEVHLPTMLNPVFRVRDHGPGMSHDTMITVYARLYASSKRKDNEKVGGWGLGSKSPFAYLVDDKGAGSYNVTSFHDGVMRAYVLSLSQDGSPVMRLLAECPTTERSGLDVSFPVRREDIRDFHDAAHDVLWSFNPRPKIFPEIKWPQPIVQSSGLNWTSYKRGTIPFDGPTVRMGCVMYPFDLRQIKTTGFLDIYDSVLFEAPIGSLKVTLSREELAYDDTTKATLSRLVEEYEQTFISQVRQKVTEAETLFNACKAFDDAVVNLGQTREERLRTLVDWRGLPITHNITKLEFKTSMLPGGWQTFEKFEDMNVRTTWATDATIVIEHNPSYSLSRFVMAELVGKKVLWVRCRRIHRDETLRRLGNPDVIDLDNFKVPVEKRRLSKTIRKRRTLEIVGPGRLQRIAQDVDLADGGYYIEQHTRTHRRGRASDYYSVGNHPGLSLHELSTVIDTCLDLGLLETGTVILLKKGIQDVPDNWTELGQDIVEALKAKIDVSEFTALHKKTVDHINRTVRHLNRPDLFADAPEDLKVFQRDITSLMTQLSANRSESTSSDKAYSALQQLNISVEKPDVICPIDQINRRFAALGEKYPLLGLILNSIGYYSIDAATAKRMKHYFGLLTRPEHPAAPAAGGHHNAEEDPNIVFDHELDEVA